MKSLLIFIGSIICTAVLFSFPVLAALSFAFNWDNFIKFIMIAEWQRYLEGGKELV